MLDIKNDFTPKEAEDVYISEAWAFKEKLSPEFAHLTYEEKRKRGRELFLQKVLPVLSHAEFRYLTPEEKREWVLVAVLIPHVRRYLESADDEYPVCPTDDEESEVSDLDESKSVRQDEVGQDES